ncbi:hypothetical protein [Streptomyces sp. NPDC088400]|uniref:hypothetical protein n=1 Tax=Streptomyces sp. NPDC088400 TaxID=3365861 RepID=UPI0037F26288
MNQRYVNEPYVNERDPSGQGMTGATGEGVDVPVNPPMGSLAEDPTDAPSEGPEPPLPPSLPVPVDSPGAHEGDEGARPGTLPPSTEG